MRRRQFVLALSIFLSALTLCLADYAAAAILNWSSGNTNVEIAGPGAPPCTLLVSHPQDATNCTGIQLIWVGNGQLRIVPSPGTESQSPYSAAHVPSIQEISDAASGCVTVYASAGSVQSYLVYVLSGNAFELAAFETAAGHSQVWPLDKLAVARINGGFRKPFRPVPVSALSAGGANPMSLEFAVLGDTAIEITLPTGRAQFLRRFLVEQADRAGGQVTAGDSAAFLKAVPHQFLVTLSTRDAAKAL
jgi:hypothetical protein